MASQHRTPDSDGARLLGPNEGTVIVEQPERRVTVKAEHALLSAAECWLQAGGDGGAPHVHRGHANAFYVLEGELVFELGRERSQVNAPAGTVATIPPGVAHAYVSAGPSDARFLEIHGPGAPFPAEGDAGAGLGSRFDTFTPGEQLPAGTRRDAVVRKPGAGDSFRIGAATLVVKASTRDSGGAFTLMEVTLVPDLPPPAPHRHSAMTDGFYVLEGPAALDLGERSLPASPGSFAFVPPGAMHAVANHGSGPARVLTLMAPGGFEAVLEDAASHLGGDASKPDVVSAHIASRLGDDYVLYPAG